VSMELASAIRDILALIAPSPAGSTGLEKSVVSVSSLRIMERSEGSVSTALVSANLSGSESGAKKTMHRHS